MPGLELVLFLSYYGKTNRRFKITPLSPPQTQINGLIRNIASLQSLEKWHKTLDKGGEAWANLTDIFKAFDYTDHNLLIAKFNACTDLKNSC